MAANKTKAKLDFIKADLRILAEAEYECRIAIYPVEPDTGNKDQRYYEVREAWGRLLDAIYRPGTREPNVE